MPRNLRSLLFAITVLVPGLGALAQGKVVACSDDWTLSDSGFSSAPDAGAFAVNVANWFAGGGTGSFLAYSVNFGLTGTSLKNAMENAGHKWNVDATMKLDAATLLNDYDGLFLLGSVNGGAPDNQVLIDYVRMGGNVYVGGGAGGFGGATAEAQAWNQFLQSFGLSFDESGYNPVIGTRTITPAMTPAEHPILEGVGSLYFYNGNTVHADATARVLAGGLLGVSESAPIQSFGMGCPGSAGLAVLEAHEAKIDDALGAEVGNVPMASALVGLGIGFNVANPVIDLGSLGIWNCTLYVDPFGVPGSFGIFPMMKSGAKASLEIKIVNDPSLIGLIFYLQALVEDAGAPNPVGYIVTNAVKGYIQSN